MFISHWLLSVCPLSTATLILVQSNKSCAADKTEKQTSGGGKKESFCANVMNYRFIADFTYSVELGVDFRP